MFDNINVSTVTLTGASLIYIGWICKIFKDDIVFDANSLAAGGMTLFWAGFTLEALKAAKNLRESVKNYLNAHDACEENDSDSDCE